MAQSPILAASKAVASASDTIGPAEKHIRRHAKFGMGDAEQSAEIIRSIGALMEWIGVLTDRTSGLVEEVVVLTETQRPGTSPTADETVLWDQSRQVLSNLKPNIERIDDVQRGFHGASRALNTLARQIPRHNHT
jgi:hypothetical protein